MTGSKERLPAPTVVSAGGLIYRRYRGRVDVVLAGRRRKGGEITWGLPKGRVEAGESERETARREVREETGIWGELETELGEIRYAYVVREADARRRRLSKRVHFFLMRAVGGSFSDRDVEMDVVRWFPIGEAEGVINYENERRIVRRARALIAASPARKPRGDPGAR